MYMHIFFGRVLNCNFYIYRLDSISRYRLKGDGKMKIEDNRDNTRHFSELVVGDVFTCENVGISKLWRCEMPEAIYPTLVEML